MELEVCKSLFFQFVSSKADASLFLLQKSIVTIYLLIYVDDILVVSSSPQAMQ